METYDIYRLLITPLSPVHVGTGGTYDPTNYVIEDDALYEFDTIATARVLSQSDKELLIKITTGRADQDMVKDVQSFFYKRRADLIRYATNRIPVPPGVAEFYRSRVGKTAQREESGREIINELEIERTAFNPVTKLPVLFGSSLKGAIRTALLDAVNGGQPCQGEEKNRELQQRLFKFERGFQRDPMRLVQVGDASWFGKDGLPAAMVQLAVNRKREAVSGEQGNAGRFWREDRSLLQFLECLPPMYYRALSAQFNIQKVSGLETTGKVPASELQFTISDIARACNDFYGTILREQLHLFGAVRGFLSRWWCKAIRALLEEKGINGGGRTAFLLRVGRHSGADSLTVRGVRKIRISRGRRGPREYRESPTTVWLAAEEPDQGSEMLPFGWLFVEVFPGDDGEPGDCDALRKLCDSYVAPMREWVLRQEELAEERARQRQEKEARQLREKQAAKARAEEEARLAAMSSEERTIEKLRRIYEADKAANRREPQGELANCRAELLREAATWESNEMRRKAAALIEETISLIPWPKKKRAEREKELDELRKEPLPSGSESR